MNTQPQIRITREDGRRALAVFRQLVAAATPVDDRPDDRGLPEGYSWVKTASGWVPLEDALAC